MRVVNSIEVVITRHHRGVVWVLPKMPTAELNTAAARMLVDITVSLVVVVFFMLSVTKPNRKDATGSNAVSSCCFFNLHRVHGKEFWVVFGFLMVQ